LVSITIEFLVINFEPKLALLKKSTDVFMILYFWAIVPFILEVDYIKGIFRPFVCYALTILVSYNRALSEMGLDITEFTHKMVVSLFYGISFEFIYWNYMQEKAMLFLKTEVSSR